MNRSNRWPNFFPSGSIAIVGNGRSLLGGGKGAEIDAADNVFRFHFYKLEGFEQDAGSRCDYWVSSFYRSGLRDGNFKGVYCPLPLNSPEWEKRDAEFYDDGHDVALVRSLGPGVCCIPEDLYFWLLVNNKHPSTGLALIWWMHWTRGLDGVKFYGFDHFANPNDAHYWESGSPCGNHLRWLERAMFNALTHAQGLGLLMLAGLQT